MVSELVRCYQREIVTRSLAQAILLNELNELGITLINQRTNSFAHSLVYPLKGVYMSRHLSETILPPQPGGIKNGNGE
jgi:hypothetical protein